MSSFQDRKDRLKDIVSNMSIRDSFPLVYGITVPPGFMDKLCGTINYYVWVSLCSAFPSASFDLCPELLDRYQDQVSYLPNMTPNGLILPKRENFLAYHEIHKVVASLLDSYDLSTKLASIHNPINIRLVRGTSAGATRPKSSTKLHTDIWAGEYSNSMMVFIPAMGDIRNIGVEFYEPPADFYPNYVKILDDYNEGAHFIDTSNRYDCTLENGLLYVMDPFLLHKTFKRSEGWRLSLDFRFLPALSVPTDVKLDTPRDENYISYSEWRKFGFTKLLFTDTPIDVFDAARNKNAYAASYEIREL